MLSANVKEYGWRTVLLCCFFIHKIIDNFQRERVTLQRSGNEDVGLPLIGMDVHGVDTLPICFSSCSRGSVVLAFAFIYKIDLSNMISMRFLQNSHQLCLPAAWCLHCCCSCSCPVHWRILAGSLATDLCFSVRLHSQLVGTCRVDVHTFRTHRRRKEGIGIPSFHLERGSSLVKG